VPAGRIPVSFNQLPSQVVKTTPQLIQDFSAQQGDRVGDRGANPHLIDSISGLRIIPGAESIGIGFAEGLQPAIEITDVLFGPFDFRPDTDQSV
jgi:hypothetical protein